MSLTKTNRGPEGVRRHVKAAALASLLVGSAALLSLALRSHGQPWLGWLVLLPLFAAIRTCRVVGALASGALWGLSLYVFSVDVPESGVSEGLRSLVLLTAVPAIYACVGSVLTRRIGFSPFVLGVSWMGVELGLESLGLHNGLLAGLQGDGTPVHWVGNALGYVLVAFLVAYVNACLFSVLNHVWPVISRPYPVAGSGAYPTRLWPQTFSCFPLFIIRPAQPRAPPA